MNRFNVARINLCTEAEGPGKRLAIWFQGCDAHCRGCCNPSMQPFVPVHIMPLEDLLAVIADAAGRFGIEGVTYSGGEPALQEGLPALTAGIRDMGLGVISFTGKRYEDVEDALAGCDLVLDGEYRDDLPERSRRLIGSANQRMIYLTERYRPFSSWWTAGDRGKYVEVNVSGTIVTNGDMWCGREDGEHRPDPERGGDGASEGPSRLKKRPIA